MGDMHHVWSDSCFFALVGYYMESVYLVTLLNQSVCGPCSPDFPQSLCIGLRLALLFLRGVGWSGGEGQKSPNQLKPLFSVSLVGSAYRVAAAVAVAFNHFNLAVAVAVGG